MKIKMPLWLLVVYLLGTGMVRADSRIVGGIDATPGSWPWLVALSHLDDNYKGEFCGGTLIKPDWVVTASHCLEGENADSFHVVAGVYDLKQDKGQQIKVKRIIMHPKYNSFNKNFDVALVQLKSKVKNAVTIPLIAGTPGLSGVMATVVGWGNMSATEYDFYPFKLQEVQVPVVSNRECRDVFEQKGQSPTSITHNMLCAGKLSGGEDSCQGDSGGPLMVQQAGRWVLAGVVSWGDGCALPLNYGVYSRVSKLAGFIDEKISIDYIAEADANHDGKIDEADKQAKSDALQGQLQDYVERCWTPAADCGDVTGDDKVDWLDLVQQSESVDADFKTWLELIWEPESVQ